MATVHPETSLVFQRLAGLDTAESRFRTQALALRSEIRWLIAQINTLQDNITDAQAVETDPVILNRMTQLENSLGAFRHLTQTLEQAGANVLQHFRQAKQDRDSLRANAALYVPNP